MQIKGVLNKYISLILSILLSVSLVYTLTSSLLFDYEVAPLFLIVLIIHIIYSFIFMSYTTLKFTGVALLSISVAAILFLLTRLSLILKAFTWLQEFYFWT